MSEEYQRIELITGTARRRRWSTEQKLRIIDESFEPGETVSSAARRNGVAPNLVYRWRRLMSEGGVTAVGSDEAVVGNSEVRKLEERVRELEPLLGRKTMENEILPRLSPKQTQKNRSGGRCRCRRAVPDEARGRGARRLPLQLGREGAGEGPAARSLPQGHRQGAAAAHPPLRRRAADLWLSPHYGAGEPGAGNAEPAECQSQTGAPHHAASCAAAGAPYRPARGPHPRRQDHGDALGPALVLRRPRVHLLERRHPPPCLYHRCFRSRDHRLDPPSAAPASADRMCAT